MVLTKTTGIFLFPAVLWMVFARLRYRWRPAIRAIVTIGATGVAVWAAYYLLLVRPHFLEDYRYLFSANGYTGISPANVITVLRATVRDGGWIGRVVYPMSVMTSVVAVLGWWRFLGEPLLPTLLLWSAGYGSFLAYHANLQPRYYLVVAVPLTLFLPLALERAWQAAAEDGRRVALAWRVGVLLGTLGIAIAAVRDAQATIGYLRTPQYTFMRAAEQIAEIIRSTPGHSDLLLSVSGSDVSLMTGIPSICDDFGTMELEDRVALYKPGWYASWNQMDDDKMDALTPMYHLERVAEFATMDDPERNLLILYRLENGPSPKRARRGKRRALPRGLVTRMGQQPSVQQLQH